MGRVDRKMTAEPGTCHYEIHISFKSVRSLYVRTCKHMTPSAFVKLLQDNKDIIFHKDSVPNKTTGTKPYHGLALQLFAKGIIAFEVTDKTKVGTKKITNDLLRITLPNGVDTDGVPFQAYMIDSYYSGMTTIETDN